MCEIYTDLLRDIRAYRPRNHQKPTGIIQMTIKILVLFLIIPVVISVLFGVFGSLFDGYFGTELTGPLFGRVLRTVATQFCGVLWAGYLYLAVWLLVRRQKSDAKGL